MEAISLRKPDLIFGDQKTAVLTKSCRGTLTLSTGTGPASWEIYNLASITGS